MSKFIKDLKWGEIGEDYIMSLLKVPAQKTGGRIGDIILTDTGSLIEVKFDRLSANSTGNLFLERYSHHQKKTLGGPLKAKENNCKYFVYCFSVCKSVFVYEAEPLVNYILEREKDFRYHLVRSSNAGGWLVPILALRHLEIKLTDME